MTTGRQSKLFRLLSGGFLFAAVFFGLQYLYFSGEQSAWKRVFIEEITLRPAVALINGLSPDQGAIGQGGSIVAPGMRLSVRTGCDGADAMVLLIAAFAAAGMGWRRMFAGMVGGVVLIWLLNQARIAALFFAFRSDRAWFDLLHGTIGPVLLILLSTVYFMFCSGMRQTLQKVSSTTAGA